MHQLRDALIYVVVCGVVGQLRMSSLLVGGGDAIKIQDSPSACLFVMAFRVTAFACRQLSFHRNFMKIIFSAASQYHDLKTIDAFDVSDRISTLKPNLLLLRGLEDHGDPPKYEKDIHDAVPGSEYRELQDMGHFPPTERPERFNALLENYLASL